MFCKWFSELRSSGLVIAVAFPLPQSLLQGGAFVINTCTAGMVPSTPLHVYYSLNV